MRTSNIVAKVGSSILLVSCLVTISCSYKKAAPPPPEVSGYFGVTGGGNGPDRVGYDASQTSVKLVAAQSGDPVLRKIIRNGNLELIVKDVDQAIGKINLIVDTAEGFIENSTQSNTGSHTAKISVRVPAARLAHTMSQIKKLSVEVQRESVEARDVTRDYIDLDARLRNTEAEEAQYLQILKRATTVKDTLDVTEKLSDVRGRVEQLQGEMKYLTTQIDMSGLTITLRPESQATVMGLHWRPLTEAKIATIEMVSGLTDWIDSVIAFLINLPLIIAWAASIILLIAVAWKVLCFIWRGFGPKVSWRFPWRWRAGTESKSS